MLICSSDIFAQRADTAAKQKKYSVSVFSDPDGAKVFIDSAFYGTTPLTIKGFSKTNFDLKLQGADNKYWMMNYSNPGAEDINVNALINKDYGLLNVSSEPEGADVYLNDSLVGKTPVEGIKTPHRISRLTIKKGTSLWWEKEIMSFRGFAHVETIKAKLHSRFGYVDFSKLENNYSITLDGKPVPPEERSGPRKLSAGEHFISAGKNESMPELNCKLNADTVYSVIEKKNAFTSKYITQSLMVPGLGQYNSGAAVKGAALFSAFIGAGAVTIAYFKKYADKADNYDQARIKYILSGNELSSAVNKELVKAAEKDKDDALKAKQISIAALIGVYVYNIIDACLFHSHEDILELQKQDEYFGASAGFIRESMGVNLNFKINL